MGQSIHPGKKVAGEKAASFVKQGMTIGLGTGSTAYWTIHKIGEMVADGLQIKAVATSVESEKLACQWHIPLVSFDEVDYLDLDIDGADEVDDDFNLIKGGGGALLREKIIANISRRMIVVADESKLVQMLGRFPLPVEVTPFGIEWTMQHLKKLGAPIKLRQKNDETYQTDNGNYILDCHFYPIEHPTRLHQQLNNIPGIVDNGIFVDLCDTIVIGKKDGSAVVKMKEPAHKK